MRACVHTGVIVFVNYARVCVCVSARVSLFVRASVHAYRAFVHACVGCMVRGMRV